MNPEFVVNKGEGGAASADPTELAEQLPPLRPRIQVAWITDLTTPREELTWLDAAQEPAALQTAIDRELAKRPTKTPTMGWAVYGSADFGACEIESCDDAGWISAVACGIAEHGLAFAAWANVMEYREFLDDFEQSFIGHFADVESYMAKLIDDLGYNDVLDQVTPTMLRPFVSIDLAGLARDSPLQRDIGIVPAHDGGVWVFKA